MRSVFIAGRAVGPRSPCFVIAEAGVNHNGRLDLALALVDAALEAGADAVKFQTFVAAELVSPVAAKAAYQRQDDAGESQLDMIRRLELPLDDFRTIKAHADRRGIMFLSTPFDVASLRLLVDLGVPALKIGSGEVTNLPFLRDQARTGLPLILSTGMSTMDEVAQAVTAIREAGVAALILLHCVSQYPTEPADANVRGMGPLAETFDVPVGYSDHTLGPEAALAAVALGACVIEKHLTLDRSLAGPDHRASMPPDEFRALVRSIRVLEQTLGDGIKAPRAVEADTAIAARRSVVVTVDLEAGTILERGHLAIRRPGTGLAPVFADEIVGRVLRLRVLAGQPLTWELLE